MSVKVYMTSVSSDRKIKNNQQRIELILGGKKINFEAVDIAQNPDDKEKMRNLSGNPKALPPQIFNGDAYCGDFDEFENAVECDTLNAFLKL